MCIGITYHDFTRVKEVETLVSINFSSAGEGDITINRTPVVIRLGMRGPMSDKVFTTAKSQHPLSTTIVPDGDP